jgi:hypothetical protein
VPQGALSGQPTSSPMSISALTVVGLYVVLLIAVRPFGSSEDMVRTARLRTEQAERRRAEWAFRYACLRACLLVRLSARVAGGRSIAQLHLSIFARHQRVPQLVRTHAHSNSVANLPFSWLAGCA